MICSYYCQNAKITNYEFKSTDCTYWLSWCNVYSSNNLMVFFEFFVVAVVIVQRCLWFVPILFCFRLISRILNHFLMFIFWNGNLNMFHYMRDDDDYMITSDNYIYLYVCQYWRASSSACVICLDCCHLIFLLLFFHKSQIANLCLLILSIMSHTYTQHHKRTSSKKNKNNNNNKKKHHI